MLRRLARYAGQLLSGRGFVPRCACPRLIEPAGLDGLRAFFEDQARRLMAVE